MYSYEIENFLKERNFKVSRSECMELMNRSKNPQISEIRCLSSDGQYLISTDDKYTFKFWVK